jgi:hypothetical protein
MRAALPLEDRLMQEALVYRDDGAAETDYDVTGMLTAGSWISTSSSPPT